MKIIWNLIGCYTFYTVKAKVGNNFLFQVIRIDFASKFFKRHITARHNEIFIINETYMINTWNNCIINI